MNIPHSPNPYLPVFTAAGVKTEAGPNGAALTNGVTYYVPFGIDAATLIDVMVQWDAAIVLTSVEVETSCNPDATVYSTTAGEWVKRNVVGTFGVLDAAAGVTALTLAVAGGSAGGATWSLSNGALRGRLKVVVGATGGTMKFTANGKA